MDELCMLCPRKCNVNRKNSIGFCGAPFLPTVAKAMLHKWEEPCICYKNGSGAVFFSGCQLKCVFCQNHDISDQITGKTLDANDLSDLFLKLQEKGACNINLVSPTPYLNTIIPALEKSKKIGLTIPIVFNSGGYESPSTIKKLNGLVDIYLPDFKFYSTELSARYAKAKDYAKNALDSILEMLRQTSPPLWDGDHLMRGIIIRHLVLPGSSKDSVKILELIATQLPKDDVILSLMRQYTPMFHATDYAELTRTVTSLEYNRVVDTAQKLGFTNVYTQSAQSSGMDYVPNFSTFFDETN